MSKDQTHCKNGKGHLLQEDYGERPTSHPRVTMSKNRNPTQGRLRRDVFQTDYDFYGCEQCGLYCYTVTGRPIGGGRTLFKNGLFFEKDAEGLFVNIDGEGLFVNIDGEGLFFVKNAEGLFVETDADEKEADT